MNENIYRNLSDMLSNASVSSVTENKFDLNNSDIFKNIISNFASNNTNSSNFEQNNDFNFSNIDMETIMKIKKIMSKMSSNAHNPRSNLLLSLKPYLKPSRKEKLDQYIQFINMTSLFEGFNDIGGDK